jgi:hypothetical protein
MRIIKLTLSALLLAAALIAPGRALAADRSISVRAVLIIASNEKGPADPKLAAYEATLQRNVPESSFRFAAEGSASVSGNGHATLTLGQGHRIELEGESGSGIRLKVEWMNDGKLFVGGSFILEPGVPLMLGRRPVGDGQVPIVLLIAK